MQPPAIGLAGSFKEDAGDAACGVQVEMSHDFLCQCLHIPVDEGKEPEPGSDDKGPFGCLEQGDGVKCGFWVPLGGGHGVVSGGTPARRRP